MARRSSSTNRMDSGISREIGSDLAKVRIVADNIAAIISAAGVDLEALAAALEKATDFEGITVVAGTVASWNADTKVLTVPAVKGDKGDTGSSLTVTSVTAGAGGVFVWVFSDGTTYTTPSLKGGKGDKGDKGDDGLSTSVSTIAYQGNGVFLWAFSDGTTYLTPDLRGVPGPRGLQGGKGDAGDALNLVDIISLGEGKFLWTFSDGNTYVTPSLLGPKGDRGFKGDRGLQGVSVHHMKGTHTTDLEGDFTSQGEIDTFTFYGDADETNVLGWFRIRNGIDAKDDALAAAASALLAMRWATESEDTPVIPGKYSAYHHATKAAAIESVVIASRDAAALSESKAKTSETNAKTSETNAKTSETNANQSAIDAAASAASIVGDEASAAASAAAALISKNAASVSQIAAAASEGNAASSESAAAGSASAASTSESNALASKNAAAGSASIATTKASEASTSAVAANASEISAANSASAAAGSATAADTSDISANASKLAAAASLKDFRERYYGAYATTPTADPYGGAISYGDLYFNTTYSQLMVWADVAGIDVWKYAGLGPKGDKGDNFGIDASGTMAERSNYDLAAQGFTFYATDQISYDNAPPYYESFEHDVTMEYTLSQPIGGAKAILVTLNGVNQSPASYTVTEPSLGVFVLAVDTEDGDTVSVREFAPAFVYGAVYFKLSNNNADWSSAIPFNVGTV